MEMEVAVGVGVWVGVGTCVSVWQAGATVYGNQIKQREERTCMKITVGCYRLANTPAR